MNREAKNVRVVRDGLLSGHLRIKRMRPMMLILASTGRWQVARISGKVLADTCQPFYSLVYTKDR